MANTLAVVTLGRMNPLTKGHLMLLEKVVNTAKEKGGDPILFLTHTQDKKKNPLPWELKVQHVKSAVGPQLTICEDDGVKTAFDFMVWIGDHQYTEVIVIAGADRVQEFEDFFNKYNGIDTPRGTYNFNKITVVSAGARDPDGEGVASYSATKARNAALDGDFETFRQIAGVSSEKLASDMFNSLRKFMGLGESNLLNTSLSINERELTHFFKDLPENVVWDILQDTLQEEANRQVQTIAFKFPPNLVGASDIHSQAQLNGALTSFGRGVIAYDEEYDQIKVKIGPVGSSHVGLGQGLADAKRFYWGYNRENSTVYVVTKNGMDEATFRKKEVLQKILSQIFDMLRLSISPSGLKIQETLLFNKKKLEPMDEEFIGYYSNYFTNHRHMGDKNTIIIFKNPRGKEWDSIPSGARGWAGPSGDVYIEGSDDPSKRSLAIHSDILMALKSLNVFKREPPQNLVDDSYDWASSDAKEEIGHINIVGFGIHRVYDTKKFGLAESYGPVGRITSQEGFLDIIKNLKEKNPEIQIVPKNIRIINGLDEDFVGYGNASLTDPNPRKIPIYKNPSRSEMKLVMPWARGWLAPGGDLYVEGSDTEEFSNFIHGHILNALHSLKLFKTNPPENFIGDIRVQSYKWSTLKGIYKRLDIFGVGVQRSAYTNTFGTAESYDYSRLIDNPYLDKVFENAKKKNPGLTFEI